MRSPLSRRPAGGKTGAHAQETLRDDPVAVSSEPWTLTGELDRLGLRRGVATDGRRMRLATESFQRSREVVIVRQPQELLGLSTPLVELWEGILALPLIGTLDSARTQIVMESLLQDIVDTGAGIATIDIKGVPTVATLVVQHLLKTVSDLAMPHEDGFSLLRRIPRRRTRASRARR